jgi:two-component system, NarL family, nitrate/nitrite response regulator NarL
VSIEKNRINQQGNTKERSPLAEPQIDLTRPAGAQIDLTKPTDQVPLSSLEDVLDVVLDTPRIYLEEHAISGSPDRALATTSVVIVDSLPITAVGTCLLLASQADLKVVGHARTTVDALQLLRATRPQDHVVAVIDIGLRDHYDALWLIKAATAELAHVAILVHGADEECSLIARAFLAGADSFVDRSAHPLEFLDVVRRCAKGEVAIAGLDSTWVRMLAEEIERQRNGSRILTERELQVISLAADGLTAREVADRLGLQERTITTHLGRIYAKLGVHGRVAALAAAAKLGLLPERRD